MPLIMSRINQENLNRPSFENRRFAMLSNDELAVRMCELQAKVEAYFAEIEQRRSAPTEFMPPIQPGASNADQVSQKLSPVCGSAPTRQSAEVEFHLDA